MRFNFVLKNRNKEYSERVRNILELKSKEIFSFFETSDNDDYKVNVYIYDTIEELTQSMKERGFKNMPSYMCACYKDEDNSINLFEPKDNPDSNEWDKDSYDNVIFHEEIHAIQNQIYGRQPEWLTEGIAKYLDGTYSRGINWLLENYINNNSVPNQIKIEEEFGMHEYDSYDYAYLMVSYLIETLGKSDFLEVIKDENKVDRLKENLLNNSIQYYNEKYGNRKRIR